MKAMLKQLWIELRVRLAGVFFRDRLHARADEEIRTHIAMREERLIESGLSVEDARLQARREFGNPVLIRERAVDLWPLRFVEVLRQDFRFAARALTRTPAFCGLSVLTLAMGIGVTGGVFSLVDALFLRDLPLSEPDRLAALALRIGTPNGAGEPLPVDPGVFDDIGALPVFSGVAGEANLALSEIRIDGAVEPRRTVWRVTENYFDVLGIAPSLGRIVLDTPTAILSDRYWAARFQSDPDVVGRVLTLDGTAFMISGVAPRGFAGLRLDRPVDAWVIEPGAPLGRAEAVVRLGPGVSLAQVRTAVDSVIRNNPIPTLPASVTLVSELTPAGKGITSLRQQYRRPLLVLSLLVGLVLAATCLNIGNLLVARSANRSAELTLRAVLGAGHLRLLGHFVAEGVLLVSAGCVLALPVAVAVGSRILSMLPLEELPGQLSVRADLRLFAFLTAVSAISALMFSVMPAWRSLRTGSTQRLAASRQTTAPRERRRLERSLVSAQVVISVVLLSGAVLFVQTLENAAAIDPGFEAEGLLHVHIGMPYAGYNSSEEAVPIYRLLRDRLSGVDGVASVSASRNPLMMPGPAFPVDVGGITGQVGQIDVTAGFFETMGIRLLRGRSFTPADEVEASRASSDGDPTPLLLVVSESFVQRFYPDEDPIGRAPLGRGGSSDSRIIGVVADARLRDIHDAPFPTAYTLFLGSPSVLDAFVLRIDGDTDSVIRSVQQSVMEIEPRLLTRVDEMRTMIRRSMARERLVAATGTLFGSMVLALAGIGLFGMASLTVARRTNELGVRIALGASRRNVIVEVLHETVVVLGLGLLIGGGTAATLARVAGSQIDGLLFGLEATDPRAIAAATLAMATIAVLACVIPAARALWIDPLNAIRHE